MHLQDTRILARGVGLALPGHVLGRAIAILTQVVLARLLGTALFGLYSLGYTLLRLGEMILPQGMDQGVLRFGAAGEGTGVATHRGVIVAGLGVALLTGVVTGAGLFLLAPLLAEAAFHDPGMEEVLRGIAPGLAAASGLQVASAATRLTQRMQYAVLTQDLGQPLVNLVLAVLLVWLGWGLRGALGAVVASYAAAFLGAVAVLARLFPRSTGRSGPREVPLGKLLAFSLPASLARIFASMVLMFDRVLIGLFRPASDVGIYQAASLSASIFSIILVSLHAVLAPMVADLDQSGERYRIGRLYRLSTRWGISLGLPFYLLILIAPAEILRGAFGNPYAEAALPLVILATAQYASLAVGGVGVLLPMTGHEMHWLRLAAGAVALHLTASVVLVPRFGIVGGALGTAMAMLSLFAGGLIQVRHRLRIWPYDRGLRRVLWSGLAAAIAAVVVRQILTADPLLKVVVLAAVLGAVVTVTLVLQGIEPEERDLLMRVRSRVEVWWPWAPD